MHEQYLLAALEQARLGRGQCTPNPSVGAVAVQNGIIIAQDWHRGAGTSHAEHLLLAQFPPKTPGVTLYVTLEPCNHWGKTPPCVEAIIAHGVEHVVFAYMDPNPIVHQNNSSEKLRAHNINVTHLPVAQINEFYDSYAYWMRTQKPRVTVKLAQSLDGKIAGPQGQRRQLSNELCGKLTHQLRRMSDVILTSSHTIVRDNPLMNVRIDGIERSKPVAIVDSRLSLDPAAQVFTKASCCHIYHCQDEVLQDYPNSVYHHMPETQGRIPLSAVIDHLGALGFHDVWVEAGGTLFTALHQQGLVHRTYLYVTPTLLGEDALSAFGCSTLFDRPHQVSWQPMGDNVVACFDWQEDVCLPE